MADQKSTRTTWRFDGYVTAVAADGESRYGAFALGTGKVRLVDFGNQVAHASREVKVHDGAVMAMAGIAGGFVTAGDDGAVKRVTTGGDITELIRWKNQWVEHVAVLGDGRIAAAVGRNLHLVGPGGGARTFGPHASTITGLAVAGNRMAVCHYNGVTVYDLADLAADPVRLEWKGSHLTLAISPDGQFLATATQDHDIHAWRLDDHREMRMSGYPSKVKSLSWTADSLLLATSGAEVLAAWPFDGPGPEGRSPVELYDGAPAFTSRVACHPFLPMIAGGFADGTAVMADVGKRQVGRLALSKQPVSALAWSPDGAHLLAGTEDGRGAIFSVPALARAVA